MWSVMTGDDIELRAIPLIDGHCHSISANCQGSPVESFLRIFTEAADGPFLTQHVPQSLTFQRSIRDLAAFLACAPTPEAILEARRQRPDYPAALCRDAGIRGLLVDRAYPPGTLSPTNCNRD